MALPSRSKFVYFGYEVGAKKKDMRYLYHLLKKNKNPQRILDRCDLVINRHPDIGTYIHHRDNRNRSVLMLDVKVNLTNHTWTLDNGEYKFLEYSVVNGELKIRVIRGWSTEIVSVPQLPPSFKRRITTYE